MTGSLVFNRQHSSTAGSTTVNKMARPKPRRCSSVHNHNSIELTPDDKPSIKREPISSDVDSGVEDLDQQVINYGGSPTNDDDEGQSPILFGACDDEFFTENRLPYHVEEVVDPEQELIQRIRNDLALAAKIPNYEKKDFCVDTREVFHGEFTRRISFPIALYYPDVRYFLFAEDEVEGDPYQWPGFGFVRLDNAKAQFKCPNPACQRSWTSMRARISFKISQPQSNGYIVLKIFGQKCQDCQTPADALWYMEEVCRVMGNLTKTIFDVYFPAMINSGYLQDDQAMENFDKAPRRPRHDPYQRKGNMHAQHDKNYCEACQHGLCYV